MHSFNHCFHGKRFCMGKFQATRIVWMLALAFLGIAASGCFLDRFFLMDHPMYRRDYDGRYGLFDFRVGDRFEVLQDMYLLDISSHYKGKSKVYSLADERILYNNPSIPLIRIVPAGETIEIMSLKMTRYQKYLLVFFRLTSGEEWVMDNGFELPHYYRTFFKKVSAETGFPSDSNFTDNISSQESAKLLKNPMSEILLMEEPLTRALEEFHRTNNLTGK